MREKPDIAGCKASECHLSSPLKSAIPMDSDSAPQSGKHRLHISGGSKCDDCHGRYNRDKHHKDGTVDGRNASIDIVLFNNKHITTKWDISTENCSSIDCHGGGTVQVNWYSTASGCLACHGGGGYNDPTVTNGDGASGKHKAHTAKVACEVCHYNYKEEPTHMNGVYGRVEAVNFVARNPVLTPLETFTFESSNGKCSNIKCHGNTNDFDWYASGASYCKNCHSAGSSLDPDTSGAHQKHNVKYGDDCTKCHAGYSQSSTHMNGGPYDNPASTPGMISFGGMNNLNNGGSYDPATETCSNLYCHGGTGSSITWTDTISSTDCQKCHYLDATVSPMNPLTSSGTGTSGKHVAHYTEANIGCNICHSGYTGSTTHTNGVMGPAESGSITVFSGSYNNPTNPSQITVISSYNKATSTCQNISCHSNSDASWIMASNNCMGCHGDVKTGKKSEGCVTDCSINPLTTNGEASDGKHKVHVQTKSIDCLACHSGYTSNTNHINNIYGYTDITSANLTPSGQWPTGINVAYTFTEDDNNNRTGNCANVSCHGVNSGGAAGFAWYASQTSCTSCHMPGALTMNGGASIDPYSNGNHSKHAGSGAGEKSIDCTICHNNYGTSATHTNGTKDPVTTTGLVSFVSPYNQGIYDAAGTKACSQVTCHGGDTSSGGYVAPVWGGASLTCTACHFTGSSIDPMTTSGTGTAGKHTAHVTNKSIPCDGCHNQYNLSDKHGNGAYGKNDIEDGDINPNGSWGTPPVLISNTYQDYNSTQDFYGSCNLISCHGGGDTGGISWYANSSAACMVCHNVPALTPSTGKHTKHITDSNSAKITDCNLCHFNYKAQATHMNSGTMNPAEVAVDDPGAGQPLNRFLGSDVTFTPSGTPNSGVFNCNNISCHGGNPIVVSWYNPSQGCLTCHAAPSSGSHNAHLAALDNNCSKCHYDYQGQNTHQNGTVNDTTTASNMINIIDFDNNPGGTYVPGGGPDTGQCNSVYCHGNFTGGNNASVTWGSGTVACGSCHNAASPSTGSHSKHLAGTAGNYSYACVKCHDDGNGVGSNHHTLWKVDGVKTVVFDSWADNGAASGTMNGAYSGSVSKTCSNVYCHGDFSGGKNASPVWGSSATAGCGTCHDKAPIGGTGNPTEFGSHDKHTNSGEKNYDCSVCHSTYATGTEATAAYASTAKHANFIINVAFDASVADRGFIPSPAYNITTKNCNGVYCHGNISNGADKTANWTARTGGACGECHSASPTSGSHSRHIGTGANYSYACTNCHNAMATKHIDGTIGDVVFNSWADNGAASGTMNGAYSGSGTKTCSNVYCHGDFSGGKNDSPVWGMGPVACNSCHETAPVGNSSFGGTGYGSHDRHTDLTSKNYDCSVCHSGFATGNEASAAYSSVTTHANFAKNVALNNALADRGYTPTAAFDPATKNCSGVYCHGNISNGLIKTANWTARTGGACGECHNATNPGTGSHTKHIAGTSGNYTYPCTTCHNDLTKHVDGNIGDIKFDADADKGPNTASFNTGANTCANTYCHGDFDGGLNAIPVWGTQATGACGTCHDNAPLKALYGVHDKHSDAVAGGGKNYNCSVCHNGVASGTEGSVSIASTSLHANYYKNVVFNTAVTDNSTGVTNSSMDGSKNCNGIYCHGDFTGGIAINTPNWSARTNGACGNCHDASKPTSGSHTKHVDATGTNYNYPCTTCHSTSTHANGIIGDVSFDTNADKGPGTVATFNPTSHICASTYCHGDFNGGKNASPVWGTPATGACGTCHDLAPLKSAYGSHDKHTDVSGGGGKNYDCSVCHSGEVTGAEGGSITFVSRANHANFNKNISFNTAVTDNGTGSTASSYSTVTTVCSGTYCHGDFTGGSASNAPNWSARTGGACGNCHEASKPTSGSHTKHVDGTGNNYSYTCNQCHFSSTHISGSSGDISFNSSLADKPGSFGAGYVFGTKTCNNTYCHGDFTGGNNASPVWGSGAVACVSCHNALSPSTGAHAVHVTTKSYTCITCHGTATHANGISGNEISFSPFADKGPGTAAYTPGGSIGTGTCANTYCHGDFTGGLNTTPQWDLPATGACGTCHSSTNPGTGKHTIHVGGGSNYSYACSACHNNYSSIHVVDVPREINFDSNGDKGPGTAATYNLTNKTCSYTYCHGDFQGGIASNVADWTKTGAGSGGACGECHVNAPSGTHDIHTDSGQKNYNCSYCHSGEASGTEGGGVSMVSRTLHANFAKDVVFQSIVQVKGTDLTAAYGGEATKTCSSLYCHGDFNGGIPGNVGDWDAGTGGACGNCHSYTNPSRFAHTKHVGGGANYSYSCDTCHSMTTHGNGTLGDITFSANADKGPGTAYVTGTQASTQCFNTYCHGDFAGGNNATPVWGTPSTGACGTCHGEVATSRKAPLNVRLGKHQKHTDTNANSGYNYDCANCHDTYASGKEGGAVTVPVSTHANYTVNVKFNVNADKVSGASTAAAYVSGTRTCTNTYCHGDFNGGYRTDAPLWTGTLGTCSSNCHAIAPVGSSTGGGYGSHDKHTDSNRFKCQTCHYNYVTNNSNETSAGYASRTTHADFTKNVAFDPGTIADQGPATAAIYDPVAVSCQYTYCHGDFTGNSVIVPVTANIAWWTSPVGDGGQCGDCHATNTPSTGSHTKHVGAPYTYTCVTCHNSNVYHVNGTFGGPEIVVFDSRNANATYTGSFALNTGRCNFTYCHGNNRNASNDWADSSRFHFPGSANNNDPLWSVDNNNVKCYSCHDYLAPKDLAGSTLLTTGSHKRHLGNTASGSSTPDTTKPTISAFTVPAASLTNRIAVSAFTATDNIKVDGYLINETATTCSAVVPTATDPNWNAGIPQFYQASGSMGSFRLCAWVKDSASPSNISDPGSYTTVRVLENYASSVMGTDWIIQENGATQTWAITGGQLRIASDSSDAQAERVTISTTHMPLTAQNYDITVNASIQALSTTRYWTIYFYTKAAANTGYAIVITGDTTRHGIAEFDAQTQLTSYTNRALFSNTPSTTAASTFTVTISVRTISASQVNITASYTQDWGFGNRTGTATYNDTTATTKNAGIIGFGSQNIATTSYVNDVTVTYANYSFSPIVKSFDVPDTSSSTTVAINSFTGYDTDAIAGYMVTLNSTPPLASDPNWLGTAPASKSGLTNGTTNSLYAWVKDSGGNVSASVMQSVYVNTTVSMDYNYPCRRCHSEAFSGDTTTITNKHADGSINVLRDVNNPSGTYSDNPGNICASWYCHGNFSGGLTGNTAVWGTASTGNCGTCHDNAPDNMLANGSHNKHTNSAAGYNYDCSYCHEGIASGKEGGTLLVDSISLHANFSKNIDFNNKADQGPGTAATYTAGTKACASTYCHGDFRSSTNVLWREGNTSNSPTWYAASTAACGTCHGVSGTPNAADNAGLGIPNANNLWNATAESHVKHAGVNKSGILDTAADISLKGYNYPCGYCHNGVYDGTLSTGNGTGGVYETGVKTANYTAHADGVRTPLSFYTAFTTTGTYNVDGTNLQAGTCQNTYCHSDGSDPATTIVDTGGTGTPRWGTGSGAKSAMACSSCHATPPTHFTGGDTHVNTSAHNRTCAHCHANAVVSTIDTGADKVHYDNNRHVNRWKNITLSDTLTSSTGGNHYYNITNRNCYVSCHGRNHNPLGPFYGNTPPGSRIHENQIP